MAQEPTRAFTVVYVKSKAIRKKVLLSLSWNGAFEVNLSALFRIFCLILILSNF